MEIDLYTLLSSNALLLIFAVICLGYLIGHLRIGSIELGNTAGVLIAGLVMGHFGFEEVPGVGSFGFTLFIFSVGLQAGPSFFSAFREDGRSYIVLAAIVAASGVTLVILLSRLLQLEPGFNAGLLAGAFTSTPTLAGAEDAIKSGLARLPEGVSPRQAGVNVSVAYAITYLFGIMGTILAIRLLPRMAGIDLQAEARELARERGIGARRHVVALASSLPVIRVYRVEQEIAGQNVMQRRASFTGMARALKIRRDGELIDPDDAFILEEGDLVSVVGDLDFHMHAQREVGDEVLDPELLDFSIVTLEIVVTRAAAVNRPLSDLGLTDSGYQPAGLTRASIDVPITPDTVLQRGDQLRVTGEEGRVRDLAERIGHVEEEVEDTDLKTFAGGIVLGTLIGLVAVKLGGITVGLGTAGGLLVVGIVIGFLSSINPTFGRVPGPAKALLMEFGLVMFMASVGLKAGGGVVTTLGTVGSQLVLAGVTVTLVPIGIAYVVGRYALKLNPAILFGSIAGAMTSTPALNVLAQASRSPVPGLGYAGTYTIANVLLTFSGTLLLTL